MAFLDPSKPLATCVASDCNDCPVSKDVHCHFRAKELAHFLLICLPGFLIGGAGVLALGAVPLAVWILEGFFSGVPTELDEMARLDGHSFLYFFFRVFLPINRGALGVTLFFCFMFSWVELLLARTLSGASTKPIAVVMTRTVSASGMDWGVLAAAGVLTVVPGILVVWFVRKDLVKGFALGRVS